MSLLKVFDLNFTKLHLQRLLLSKICLICIKQQKLRLNLFKGFARCKRIQDSPGFGIPFNGFRIPHERQSKLDWIPGCRFLVFRVLDSGSFVRGTWIADSNRQRIPDSLSCIPYGIPKPRIPDSTAKICWIPESQFPYMGRKGLSTTGRSFSIF